MGVLKTATLPKLVTTSKKEQDHVQQHSRHVLVQIKQRKKQQCMKSVISLTSFYCLYSSL